MLRPQDTVSRERKSLNGLWQFCLDAEGVGRTEGWWNRPLAGAREIPVPASYNDIFADAKVRDHVGDVWYQTQFRVPSGWAGERIVLRFDSATHRAVAWVNGTQVVEHEGGYTPFEADVTDVVEPGAENRVSVVVNNVLTWQSIPPGYVEETPEGRRQFYFHDFFNYAGLHRTVWLYTTPTSYVSDVTVVTGLSGSTGTVNYRVETVGAEGSEVRVALRDAEGAEVARATGSSGELSVEDVHPWRPGEGYLYDLTVELWGTGEAPIDVYSLAIGVRTVQVDGVPILSCITLVHSVAGQEVTTIEGLRDHPLVDAFVRADAVQCGFCTPGQVVSAVALVETNPSPSQDEIRHAMAGNLCRCGTYPRIEEAIRTWRD